MDEGLFSRHLKKINERESEKKKLIAIIQEETGVTVSESELSLSKKEVILSVSSVKKTKLLQKGVHVILRKHGFILH